MERQDQKKTVIHEWSGNYNSWGSEELDDSTVVLSGSKAEADLIIRGLMALKGQVLLRDATDAAVKDSGRYSDLGETPQIQNIDILLESIKEPNYVGEPEVKRL